MDKSSLTIAVVGGGSRCCFLMELIDNQTFPLTNPIIVGVADLKDDAPGIVRAKEAGIFVTSDYNDFIKRDDIDLIIELTGSLDVYNDILKKKKHTVRAIAHTTAVFFTEIYRITQTQKETNQKLKETLAKYDVLFNELIHENVLVIDADYRVMDINAALLERINMTREEAIGRSCYELINHQETPCCLDDLECPFKTARETGKPSRVTHVYRGEDKKETYLAVSCYPLVQKTEIVGAVNISRDITQEINMQKIMMQQEKLVSIGRLSAGVAHEINNPLTTVLTTAILVQEDMVKDDPLYQDLETIANETLRCRKIVKSLLDFARQSPPAKNLHDVNAIVSESFLLTKKQAAFNNVELEMNLAENLPQIYLDKDQIQQAVMNLTLNAIEATSSRGKVIVETRNKSEQKKIEVSVWDNGIGIVSENLSKIFDPFFTTKEKGTGLGLAITHGTIEQHGGTIEARSTIGKGTEFIVHLPIIQGDVSAR